MKTIAITGAAAGVGRATAHRFARPGRQIALIARDATALETVKAEVEGRGARALALPLDVADAAAVSQAAERIEQDLGPIDVWINDAMLTVFSPFSEMTAEEFRRVTEVTYLGYVHGTMAALSYMRRRNRGVIVQVGSALAYRGIPLQAAYCGAKHAIRGFTGSLRTELLREGSGVKLTIVELPAVNTPQFDWARTHLPRRPRPVPPVVQPEAVAEAIFHAANRPCREYWVGWVTVASILANMVWPGWMDRYLAKNAFAEQQTEKAVRPERRDNLEQPVTDLHRTHGRFDDESSPSAVVFDAQLVRLAVIAAGAGLFFGLGHLCGRSGGRRS
ncbi:MAG TPA: SDR family oxidoreductase [Ferrovibrio sp.]|jgi:short-subunit dehydrogenase|uniref:SDR family oxidoreductase n=1 Tax=Ferrovibrio sp. TaxID=1917215 RepID=UPI002ED515DA